MQTLKFKTNINCSGCIAKVSNTLNETVGKENWSVDTSVPEKTLTVNTKTLTGDEIETAIKSVGFKIEAE